MADEPDVHARPHGGAVPVAGSAAQQSVPNLPAGTVPPAGTDFPAGTDRPPDTDQPAGTDELTHILAAIHDGQMVPHYQPLVSLGSRRLIGVEALARWSRPGVAGESPPSEFVPRLEQAGEISALTAWMLDRATGDLANWRRRFRLPRQFRVAVNVSATELVDHRLVTMAAEAIKRHRIPPAALCLELTETARIEDLATAVEVFVRLRKLGVRMAIDDFGTGFTSPIHLEKLPFDMVKIDHSYVADVERRPDCVAFIARTVAAATRRRVDVVAEGVETHAQARALWSLGCRHGQGWSFGRAVPADSVLSTWLATRVPAL